MTKYRASFKDSIIRIFLELKSLVRYIFLIKKENEFNIPTEYKLMFNDNFNDKEWSLKWKDASEWWNQPYHQGYLKQWYDPLQIIESNDGVYFYAINKSKYFPEINTTIPVAVGIIRSRESWQYGIFTFSAKLPAGTYLWPALWLTGVYSWPPEIDLLEGYSDNTNDYHRNRNLQSNVHMLSDEKEHIFAGACSHMLSNKTTENFIKYIIWWKKDFIKLYYNGYLVRHITDKEVLYKMNEPQVIIIGTGVQEKFGVNNISPLIVNNIEVYQKI